MHHHESILEDDDISIFSDFGEQPVAPTAASAFPTRTDRDEKTAWSSSSSSSQVTKLQTCGHDGDMPLFSTFLPYESRNSTGTAATIISQDASTSTMTSFRHMSDGRFQNGHDQQWTRQHEQVKGSAASFYDDRDHHIYNKCRFDGMQTSLHRTSQTRAALFELFAGSSPLQERQCRPNTMPSSFTTSINPPPVVVVVNDKAVNNKHHHRNHETLQSFNPHTTPSSSISQYATFRSTTINVNPIIASSAPNFQTQHLSEQDYLKLFRNQHGPKRQRQRRPPQRKDALSVATTDASIQASRENCALLATIECSTAGAAEVALPPAPSSSSPPSPPSYTTANGSPTSASLSSLSSSSSGSSSSPAAPLTEEEYLYLYMRNLQVIPGSIGTDASASSNNNSDSSADRASGRSSTPKSSKTPSMRRQRRRRRRHSWTTRSQSRSTTGRHDNAALRTTGSRSITNTATALLAARRVVVGDTMLVQSQSSRASFAINMGEKRRHSSKSQCKWQRLDSDSQWDGPVAAAARSDKYADTARFSSNAKPEFSN